MTEEETEAREVQRAAQGAPSHHWQSQAGPSDLMGLRRVSRAPAASLTLPGVAAPTSTCTILVLIQSIPLT